MSILILALIDIVILAAWTPMAFALRAQMKAFALAVGVLGAVCFIAAFHQVLGACGAVTQQLGGPLVWGTLATLFLGPMVASAFINHGYHIRPIVWAFGAMALVHLVFADAAQSLNCRTPADLPPLGLIAGAYLANGLAAAFLGPLAALVQTPKARFGAGIAGLLLLLVSLELAGG